MTGPEQAQLFPGPVQARATDERYTPRWLFDAMGARFDLDVCAPPGGVPWIPARAHYTAEADGLAQPWEGLVWCNPPFSNPAPWAARFVAHRNGVILFPWSVNARWVTALVGALGLIVRLEAFRFEHPTHTGRFVPVAVALGALGDGLPLVARVAATAGATLLYPTPPTETENPCPT